MSLIKKKCGMVFKAPDCVLVKCCNKARSCNTGRDDRRQDALRGYEWNSRDVFKNRIIVLFISYKCRVKTVLCNYRLLQTIIHLYDNKFQEL